MTFHRDGGIEGDGGWQGAGATPLECGYRNESHQLVILVCRAGDVLVLERVVFPFELLTFCCPADSEVLVFSSQAGAAVLRERHSAVDLLLQSREPRADPPLTASVRDQLESLRQQHRQAPTAETRRQLAVQEHALREWLPGFVVSA